MSGTVQQTGEQTVELAPFPAYIDRQVKKLAGGYLQDRSVSVSALARLRRNTGSEVGDDPSILEWTIADLPQRAPRGEAGNEPTVREEASHTALTLFAMHQQSVKDMSMHRLGVSFGQACGRLAAVQPEKIKGIQRRFDALQTATDWNETVRHARGLIQLLRGARIPLDYAALAQDLITLRDENRANGVRLRWGRDYLSAQRPSSHETKAEA
ncbi:type I-E CRISPR-associated protein Cse2/CasB [Pseudoclavibacter sp. 13-3]|uniref:type I-E CRISPR-associated protein Cse2/CasB n=1 Tax=Pseudoclavibacter sp. 13-3 TaxID=2901228 RepID=UPI001E290BA9|nr:type I-E CRISPR-associated protein Cse2/CasB [Pseudoclavibacter sp. 13-3]MCD7100742.1 type I-E CRISPR-associated protein Cse2/CasB [Pseudoclavibacter sp. 13-3]